MAVPPGIERIMRSYTIVTEQDGTAAGPGGHPFGDCRIDCGGAASARDVSAADSFS